MRHTERLAKAACVLALAATAGGAAAGPVRRVAHPPGAAYGQIACHSGPQELAKPKDGSGCVSPKALVFYFERAREAPVAVALDADQADATAPSVLRFDFRGKGEFHNAPTVPLRLKARSTGPQRVTMMEFGPTRIDANTASGTFPVTVSGSYFRVQTYRRLDLSLGSAAEGTCRFGEAEYTVRVVDGDSNLRLGDAWARPKGRGQRLDTGAVTPGDTLVVKAGEVTRTVCYGAPVEVGGAWYDVRLSADGKNVSARPLDLPAGSIRIPHAKWDCLLVGRKHVIRAVGSDQPIAVPADEYAVTRYVEWSAPDARNRRTRVRRDDVGPGTRSKPLLVAVGKGETAEVKVGSPLTARIEVLPMAGGSTSLLSGLLPGGRVADGRRDARKPARSFRLSLALTDASGRRIGDINTPGKGRPKPPKITVRDAAGKAVFTGTLEYG